MTNKYYEKSERVQAARNCYWDRVRNQGSVISTSHLVLIEIYNRFGKNITDYIVKNPT
jgi:hypothetical protein